MSVIVEFTISTDEFLFGTALATAEGMELTLERVVPTDAGVLPFLWATGANFEAFERHVLEDPNVERLTSLDRVRDSVLYRIEWNGIDDLISGIGETDGTILEVRGNSDKWAFRVRFLDHNTLANFYNYCSDNDVPMHLQRVYTLTKAFDQGHQFGLTAEQREALVLAVQRGYFASPRQATLAELAPELGISQQALSMRVRRANEKVLRHTLLRSEEGPENGNGVDLS
ncbi:helix-turn-helix domain-containing protein [Halogranum rubrum]|uniref:Bacterio-opsin activator HTH domain protein n=1 Tax=Halogranum salarium B-1 TaxID=1210908 RepID=J2ZDV6_9EURY|nr:helix-turn-helix domain-containing protein [Halogranum salarium]EJN58860.1 Bacterio-opsin activator HTH domain protein [Halogranum salarium B-1]